MRANVGLGLGFAIPTNPISVGFFTAGNLTATVRGEFDERDRVILEGIAALDPSAVDSVNLEDNLQSRGRTSVSAVVEAGISFAKTFELNNTNALQLGVSPKYVQLRTFQYTETVSGFEDDEFDGDEYETDKAASTWTSVLLMPSALKTSGTQASRLRT